MQEKQHSYCLGAMPPLQGEHDGEAILLLEKERSM